MRWLMDWLMNWMMIWCINWPIYWPHDLLDWNNDGLDKENNTEINQSRNNKRKYKGINLCSPVASAPVYKSVGQSQFSVTEHFSGQFLLWTTSLEDVSIGKMNLYSQKRSRWSNFLSMERSRHWKWGGNNMTVGMCGGMLRSCPVGQSQNHPTGIEFNSDRGSLFCWRETHRVNSSSQKLQTLLEHCDDQTHTKIVRNSNPEPMMSHRYLIDFRPTLVGPTHTTLAQERCCLL
jgi:hypothetical protein